MNELIIFNSILGLAAGLIFGSFLNVVIHRLPRILEMEWQACVDYQEDHVVITENAYNLIFPSSHCPKCQHKLAWYENIPILSYLILRGRCRSCHAEIGLRYPLVELSTGILFSWICFKFGISLKSAAWCGFTATIIALAFIDLDTMYLPDSLTQPLIWAGLISSSFGWTGHSLSDSLWGAVFAYLFLWCIWWLFLLVTAKDGMGQGDFKLLASLGAWQGLVALPTICLVASLSAILFHLIQLRSQRSVVEHFPFGPWLVFGSLFFMVVGNFV